ncbi:unnamed protein product [Sphenostylis stenocarpa]|uniref:Uncharacterized protein n=1 Tax=Sphenostylis stenocarpa TaxID=92480 RepID=A0AA86SS16_9FABA|nr:unnamed protein product [Sphenostylis stenocarpa]
MHKTLFASDVRRNNNRLSMPVNEIRCDFLNEQEIAQLNERDSGKIIGLMVTVLDPCLREYVLPLKKWTMNTITYNLVKEWYQIVCDNNFQESQELQIWSFRTTNKLYVILNKL